MDTEASSPISPLEKTAAIKPAQGNALEAFVPSPVLATPPLASAPTVEPKTASLSKTSTSPIADAIRCEIQQMLRVEVLDLDAMQAIVNVAEKGRQLVSVRHPTARFDAEAQGLATQAGGPINGSPGLVALPYGTPMGRRQRKMGWTGPMIKAATEREFARIREALSQSPLAKAIKIELQSLTEMEPFGVTELMEIEQLAGHARSILGAALGLETSSEVDPFDPCGGGNVNAGGWGYGNPYQGFTSDETFGARVIRETGAKASVADPEKLVSALATAREKGLDDVAKHLEAQLGLADSETEEDS